MRRMLLLSVLQFVPAFLLVGPRHEEFGSFPLHAQVTRRDADSGPRPYPSHPKFRNWNTAWKQLSVNGERQSPPDVRSQDRSGSPTDAVSEEWVALYDGPGNSSDFATALVVDLSGNVYVTGGSPGSGTDYDYATIKYSALGTEQWVVRYNGPGNLEDGAVALAVDGSGNVYVTGYSYAPGTSYDYVTIKYDSSGGELWVAVYDGPGNLDDRAYALAIDDSGNVYVTGYSYGAGTSFDYATVKYSASGQELWVARYDGPVNGDDQATALALDGSGNVCVTGRSAGSGTSDDYVTIRYDASGQEQWVARYNGPGNYDDRADALAMDGSGNVYVAGGSFGSGTDYDYATIKYDLSGQEQWVGRYGPGNSSDFATALVVDGAGNAYGTGGSYGSGTNNDYVTINHDPSGQEQWVALYNGPGFYYDGASAIATDSSGNIYVTGYSYGAATSADYATIKYDASGQEQWVVRYNGTANDVDAANALTVDGSGNVYVTGGAYGSGTFSDYVTIKYQQEITHVGTGGEGVPRQFVLSQSYPNPFNAIANFEFRLPARRAGSSAGQAGIPNLSHVSLRVYDLLGREVATLVNEKLAPGVYTRQWDAAGQVSGVYFYRLQAGDLVETRKLVLLR